MCFFRIIIGIYSTLNLEVKLLINIFQKLMLMKLNIALFIFLSSASALLTGNHVITVIFSGSVIVVVKTLQLRELWKTAIELYLTPEWSSPPPASVNHLSFGPPEPCIAGVSKVCMKLNSIPSPTACLKLFRFPSVYIFLVCDGEIASHSPSKAYYA